MLLFLFVLAVIIGSVWFVDKLLSRDDSGL